MNKIEEKIANRMRYLIDEMADDAFEIGKINNISIPNPIEDLKKINLSKSLSEIWINRFLKNDKIVGCESNKITPKLHFTEHIFFMNLKTVRKLKKEMPNLDVRIFENNQEIFFD